MTERVQISSMFHNLKFKAVSLTHICVKDTIKDDFRKKMEKDTFNGLVLQTEIGIEIYEA